MQGQSVVAAHVHNRKRVRNSKHKQTLETIYVWFWSVVTWFYFVKVVILQKAFQQEGNNYLSCDIAGV